MKLVRHGAKGAEKPGALDKNGRVRDLSLLIDDWTAEWLCAEKLHALQSIHLEKLPCVAEDVRLGIPISGLRQCIAIGLNYREHAREAGRDIPAEPVVFNKAISALSGPNDAIVLPEHSTHTDWEIELGVIIGSVTSRVCEQDALKAVAGYVLVNDVSERHWQSQRGGQWVKGKSFDSFGPVGPWFVSADEIPDPQTLKMELRVNGELRQSGHTGDMIFPVKTIISYLSQWMTLMPGDLVITGTPAGVGLGMKPAQFLQKGDVLTLTMEKLGCQTQPVV